VWTGRISRIRILASALGPALNRQAGFTAARPAANLWSQWQTVLTVIVDDGSFLTCSANRELRRASRTFRLSHDLLSKLIEAGRAGSGHGACVVFVLIVGGVERIEHHDIGFRRTHSMEEVIQSAGHTEEMPSRFGIDEEIGIGGRPNRLAHGLQTRGKL